VAADHEGDLEVSTTLKQKMAGKLSGSLKSTEDRLAKADAVMAAGGLLRPPEEPSKAAAEPAAAPSRAPKVAKAAKTAPAAKQLDLLEGDAQKAPKKALKTVQAPSASRKHAGAAATVAAVGVEVDAPGEATKVKVQRETFTMLPAESRKIDEVRTRAAAKKLFTTRSAIVRAGVMALERLSDEQLLQMLGRLPVVKPGRSA
jgi:hypothetical protein